MKKLLLVVIVSLTLTGLHAQGGANPDAREKIKATRIAVITDKLGLSAEQAQQFWPVYNEFVQKRQSLVREFGEARRKANEGGTSEQEQRELLDLRHNLKRQELDLEKEYSDRLLRVIDTRQLGQLRQAEEEFRRMLRDHIQRRESRQQRIDNMRDRQQRRDRRNDGG